MAWRLSKITPVTFLVLIVAAAISVHTTGRDLFFTATGSVSNSLCAAAFVSKVDPDRTFTEEQRPLITSIGWAIRYQVDRDRHEVRASLLGAFPACAVFRQGLGCLLVLADEPVPQAAGFTPDPISSPYPQPSVVEAADPRIRRAIEQAFAEPDPAHPRLTKAVVVLHKGQLLAERYAPGYGPDTPIYAHSLSKSVVNAVIGILVRQGRLQPQQAAPIGIWQNPEDPHHGITINQLLRMEGGLPFDETDGALSPMTRMLFLKPDMAGYAAMFPLAHPPGTVWGYSNLSYLLLSRVIRNVTGGNAIDTERFIRRELFAPLRMRDAVIETAGHPSKNIASDLGISQRTVENHRAEIMKRTESKSIPALARLALAAAKGE